MAWPDDDHYGDDNLLVWTLHDSEPWIEVFAGPGVGAYRVVQRQDLKKIDSNRT